MAGTLSPAKAVLLAVHFAANANVDSFRRHVAAHVSVLRPEVLLRILLTHLPETLDPSIYTPLVQDIYDSNLAGTQGGEASEINVSPVETLSDEQASKKARQLRLLALSYPDAPTDGHDDPLTLFLFHRAYKIDRDAGMLNLVPGLLLPFVDHCDAIRTWLVSTILPLTRRNFDYHPETSEPLSIPDFESLTDAAAIDYLLSESGQYGLVEGSLGRDLRGLLGPWFHHPARWLAQGDVVKSAGWHHFMQWILTQSSRSWPLAVRAVEEYNGPADIDLGPVTAAHPQDTKLDRLLQSYLRAALGSAYSIPETSVDGLAGAWQILSRVHGLMDMGTLDTLEAESISFPQLSGLESITKDGIQNASYLRNDLLDDSNSLTTPDLSAITMLKGVVLSAFILTRLGLPCAVRSAGEMTLLQDLHEQKSESLRVVRMVSNNAPRDDDQYWDRARNDILWLHSWGHHDASRSRGIGPFGMIPVHEIEIEILKAMLGNSRKRHLPGF